MRPVIKFFFACEITLLSIVLHLNFRDKHKVRQEIFLFHREQDFGGPDSRITEARRVAKRVPGEMESFVLARMTPYAPREITWCEQTSCVELIDPWLFPAALWCFFPLTYFSHSSFARSPAANRRSKARFENTRDRERKREREGRG